MKYLLAGLACFVSLGLGLILLSCCLCLDAAGPHVKRWSDERRFRRQFNRLQQECCILSDVYLPGFVFRRTYADNGGENAAREAQVLQSAITERRTGRMLHIDHLIVTTSGLFAVCIERLPVRSPVLVADETALTWSLYDLPRRLGPQLTPAPWDPELEAPVKRRIPNPVLKTRDVLAVIQKTLQQHYPQVPCVGVVLLTPEPRVIDVRNCQQDTRIVPWHRLRAVLREERDQVLTAEDIDQVCHLLRQMPD